MAEELASNLSPELDVFEFKTGKGLPSLYLGEVWQRRELIGFLAWREIASRYRVPVFGVVWVVVQPLITVLMLTLFFGSLVKIKTDGSSYLLFALSGMLIWQYIASVATAATSVSIGYQAVLGKVYFPRLILPISMTLPPLLDFAVMALIFVPAMLMSGGNLTLNIIWFPVYLFLAVLTALGVALWLGAISICYFDSRHVMPFLLQLWLLASPVYYPASLVPHKWRVLYFLNPAAGAITGCRWSLVDVGAPPGTEMIWSFVSVSILVLAGAFFFKWMSSRFGETA